MVIATYYSTQDLTNKLQLLKRKPKLKFYHNLSRYYNELNI